MEKGQPDRPRPDAEGAAHVRRHPHRGLLHDCAPLLARTSGTAPPLDPLLRSPLRATPSQPLVRGISEGMRSGDMAGSVLQELTNPQGATVDAAPAVTSAVDQVDGGLVRSVLDAIGTAVHSGASP